jgi:uncharacterized short protein YbdD (DUF466 family)
VAAVKHGDRPIVVVMAAEEFERSTRDAKFNAAADTKKQQ